MNSFAPHPSLVILYFASVWDGFFGAIGLAALMAGIPVIVGREKLSAAGGRADYCFGGGGLELFMGRNRYHDDSAAFAEPVRDAARRH